MGEYILECEELIKYYGKNKVLDNFNLNIKRGKIVGLLGENGCGKSTLFKIINGISMPTSGTVLIDGKRPSVETKKIVSYLPDKNYLGQFCYINDVLNFFDDFYEDFDKVKAFTMLEKLKIDVKNKIDILSKGNLEKLQFVIVMARHAKLYILDEPLAAVDVVAREFIINTFLSNYDKDSTMIITTHLIRDIEKLFDEVVFVKDGKVYMQSSVEQIRNEKQMSVAALFKEVYKC